MSKKLFGTISFNPFSFFLISSTDNPKSLPLKKDLVALLTSSFDILFFLLRLIFRGPNVYVFFGY